MTAELSVIAKADELRQRLAFRVGQIEGAGLPWQRKDAALLTEAMQCISALSAGYETACRAQEATHAEGAKLARIRAILDGGRA